MAQRGQANQRAERWPESSSLADSGCLADAFGAEPAGDDERDSSGKQSHGSLRVTAADLDRFRLDLRRDGCDPTAKHLEVVLRLRALYVVEGLEIELELSRVAQLGVDRTR